MCHWQYNQMTCILLTIHLTLVIWNLLRNFLLHRAQNSSIQHLPITTMYLQSILKIQWERRSTCSWMNCLNKLGYQLFEVIWNSTLLLESESSVAFSKSEKTRTLFGIVSITSFIPWILFEKFGIDFSYFFHRTYLLCYAHKYYNLIWQGSSAPIEGKWSSSSDIEFYIDKVTIQFLTVHIITVISSLLDKYFEMRMKCL